MLFKGQSSSRNAQYDNPVGVNSVIDIIRRERNSRVRSESSILRLILVSAILKRHN